MSTDSTDSANWSTTSGGPGGATVPNSDNPVYFDGNSNANNFVMGADFYCKSLSQVLAFTKNFNSSSYGITSVSTIYFSGIGTLTLSSSSITITSDGSFIIENSVSTLLINNMNIDLKGTGSYAINKGVVTNNIPNNITFGYPGKVTTLNASYPLSTVFIGQYYWRGVLTTFNGGAVEFISASLFSLLYWVGSGSGTLTPIVQNGATWTGIESPGGTRPYITFDPGGCATNSTINIGLNLDNIGVYCYGKNPGIANHNLTSDIYAYFLRVNSGSVSSDGTLNFISNGYAITTTTLFSSTQTTGTDISTINFYLQNSLISCGSFVTTKDAGASCSLVVTNSQWSVAGAFDLSGVSTYTPDAEQITITNTSTVTNNGKTITKMIFDADTKTISVADTASYGRLLIEPGTKVKFKEGVTHVVAAYTPGDWDGIDGKLVELESLLPGTRFTITTPADI